MAELLPGTEVSARGLRWELVYTQNLGGQLLHRLRGIDGAFAGQELDLLAPFDEITPVARDLRPEKPAPLSNWLAYHKAFLLEQAFGMDALSAVQPGRLRIEPYQLVPVLRAIRMTRVRVLLADGVGLCKTIQGKAGSWLATVPGKGYFAIIRLYGPTECSYGTIPSRIA